MQTCLFSTVSNLVSKLNALIHCHSYETDILLKEIYYTVMRDKNKRHSEVILNTGL